MKNITMHTGTLRVLERLNNSVNGNPRYRLYINGVSCVTKPDSAYAYDVENLKDKKVTATIGTYYGKATLNTLEVC